MLLVPYVLSLAASSASPAPMHALPDLGQLCRGEVRAASLLAPHGVVDYASLADYGEQGNDQRWARLVSGARARDLARRAFVVGSGDWCGVCQGGEACAPDPFPEPPTGSLVTCERRGYGHGGSLVCFARRDARAPWHLALIGAAEEGNDVQDAEVEAALWAWDELWRRGQPDRSAEDRAPCPEAAIAASPELAGSHLRSSSAGGLATFAARYHAYLAVHFDPASAEARRRLARLSPRCAQPPSPEP